MGRVVILVTIAIAVIGVLNMDSGSMPNAGGVIERLASRPEVGDRFDDPDSGRFDATVFLFTCVLAAPLAAFAFAASLFVLRFAIEATVVPLGRSMGMPDGMSLATITVVIGLMAYANAESWLPRSLDLLGLIARAWVVSTT
jgi:hypothetical protein